MPKRLIKRYMPDYHKIREHKHLRFFGERLHNPNLWHLNRRSVAGAMAVGIFAAFIPMFGQMIIAAAAAMWLRVNLPLAVAMVWVTNPFTVAPIFFFTYKIGAWLLGINNRTFTFEPSLDWLIDNMSTIWQPLVLGSLLVGTLSSLIVYTAVRLAWRWYVIRKRRRISRSESAQGRFSGDG